MARFMKGSVLTLLVAVSNANGAEPGCIYGTEWHEPWASVTVALEDQIAAVVAAAKQAGIEDPMAYAESMPGNVLVIQCHPVPDVEYLASGEVGSDNIPMLWNWRYSDISVLTVQGNMK